MSPVSPLIPPPAANTLLTLLCNPRGHVFLGAEARRAGMSREHHACSGPVGGPRDRRGLVRGGPPRDGALAVGTQSRAVSPHVRIAGLPSFSVEHARPSLPYDALRCSLQSAWLRVQHTAGDGGPGPLTGWTVLKQRLSHGRGAASRASPKLGPSLTLFREHCVDWGAMKITQRKAGGSGVREGSAGVCLRETRMGAETTKSRFLFSVGS